MQRFTAEFSNKSGAREYGQSGGTEKARSWPGSLVHFASQRKSVAYFAESFSGVLEQPPVNDPHLRSAVQQVFSICPSP